MPIEILLVENDPRDAQMTQIALKDSKISVNLNQVEDGVEAMAFLYKQGKYTSMPRPDIIFLDLNLPQKDGRQVLAEIREDEALRRIPVVIMTTSEAEEDILKAYNLAANCYIVKPIDLNQFVKVVQSIKNFWFTIVTLPPE